MIILKIAKFTKQKDSMYKLLLENGETILAHEDLILKKDILLKREISDDDIANINILNNNYNAYDLAVKYIGSKYRSCFEVYAYLKSKEIDRDVINEVIDRLKKQSYLDDRAYAKAFVNDRMKFSNHGPGKIKKELEERRVDDAIIDDVLRNFSSDVEKERLLKLVPKYVKTIKNKSHYQMVNKVCDYFGNLGYNRSCVSDILSTIEYDDSEAREKEYKRLYNKYSRKYSGSDLELKIKQSMYKNGYK